MKDGFWLWRPDVRRRLNTTLLFLFVFSNYFPMGVAMASPGWYARPGLGVSRLPLEVMTFDAPGFGDLEQAVNLANGNLYVGLDQVAYNSQSQPGMTGSSTLSENLNLIGQGNGWNYAPRLRLENWVRRGGSGEQIGGGWWFTKYISGDNGVIYAANSAGDLFWYRWMTNPDGSGYWHPNSGKKIGAGGWTFADYVWGGNGIIYPVDSAGNMYWYRRVDDLDGNGYWHPNSGAWNRIGSGWGFRNLIAGENGIIYAIDWGGGMH